MINSPTAADFLGNSAEAVNVMVVNLFYHNSNLIPLRGFGYLIPRSVPFEQNPERALGVIFGSEVGVGQDDVTGTKLTVMLGGHWWDGWTEEDFPDEKSAIMMAKRLLFRHLGVSVPPTVAKARLQRNSIPQYTVGHPSRMIGLHETLKEDFGGRLKVAGASYTGVGINDCIRSARLVADKVAQEYNGSTGLDKYITPVVATLDLDLLCR
jgi:oxygen-dependent protoporphyrinogen oxidase